jgi:hypothetical protein
MKHLLKLVVTIATVLITLGCFQPVAPITDDAPDSEAPSPPSDLLGEWLFSGDVSDSSGHGRHGTAVNALLVADRSGSPASAYQFEDPDGAGPSGSYIRMAFPDLSPNPGDTYSISVSLWARADWAVENLGSLFSINADSAVAEVNIESVNGANIYISSGGSSRAPFTGHDTKLTANAWTHFVFAWDGASGAYLFYVNGTEQDTGTMTQANFAMTHLDIGRRPAASNFTGAIDDVRVYNRVLTAAEVSALAGE